MVIRHATDETESTAGEARPAHVAGLQPKARTRAGRVRREIMHSPVALISAIYLVLIVLVAILAPQLAPYAPDDQDILSRLESPSSAHLLGTDELGRDELSRLMYGARISLFIGIVGTLGGVILGTLVGLASGFFAGWFDHLSMRVIDVMYAFPGILLAIFIVAVVGPSLLNIIIALTVWGTPTLARIVRANILSLREQDYVDAARVVGATRSRIMFHHLLPNAMAPIIVYATLGVAGSLLTAAALGFLGVGVQAPTAEWGAMLSSGRSYMREAGNLVMFPGILIFLTVLTLNLVGDALRDALDPHLN
jgi:ABC-type dipeptide/oligopeptide/nickel transport system permease subunit